MDQKTGLRNCKASTNVPSHTLASNRQFRQPCSYYRWCCWDVSHHCPCILHFTSTYPQNVHLCTRLIASIIPNYKSSTLGFFPCILPAESIGIVESKTYQPRRWKEFLKCWKSNQTYWETMLMKVFRKITVRGMALGLVKRKLKTFLYKKYFIFKSLKVVINTMCLQIII